MAKKFDKVKVLKAIGASILMVGASASIAGLASYNSGVHSMDAQLIALNEQVKVDSSKISELSTALEVKPKETIKEVPVEIIKNVSVNVPVDNGKFDSLMKFIWDENGNIEFMTHDLDEKEYPKIAERYVKVIDFQNSAISEVKDKVFDKLDDKTIDGVNLHAKKMSNLKINDDFSDLVISDIDFDSNDATVTVTGKFKYDDESKYDFTAEVSFNNGDYDSMEVTSIVKE